MREGMDVNTLSRQDAAPELTTKHFPSMANPPGFVSGVPGVSRFQTAPFLEVLPGESLPELRERLRNEINHGREYLFQVQSELRENRRLLEQWAQYEQTCSLQPLDHLVQSVWLKQAVAEFLTGWLTRRQKEFDKVARKVESLARNGKKHSPRRRAGDR